MPQELTAPAALVTPATPTAPKKLTVLEACIPVSKFKILLPKCGGKKKGDDEGIEGSQGERVSTNCLFLFLSDCSGRSLSANASERLLKRLSPPKGCRPQKALQVPCSNITGTSPCLRALRFQWICLGAPFTHQF